MSTRQRAGTARKRAEVRDHRDQRTCHADRPVQGAFVIDGMLTDDSPIADILAVWVDRVADYDRAAAEIIAERAR